MRYERGIYVIIGYVAGIAANAMWISFIIAAFIPEPIGKAGGNDYSMWKYIFTPTYAGTREGINRIIAKLLCQANPANLTKFYSINVTGMNAIVLSKRRSQMDAWMWLSIDIL